MKITEILESEELYVKDLEKWSIEFRKMLTYSPAFVSENKLSFITIVFSNLDQILDLHKKILRDFKESGIKIEHNFTEILLDYVDSFDCYKKYTSDMTIADYYFRVELTKSLDFRNLISNFLKTYSQIGLSYTHFLFRPTQKLIRYELLFSKIKKKEPDWRKEKVTLLLEKLSSINKEIDSVLAKSKNQARIFEIFHTLKSGCTNNICLDLIDKKRVILKEGLVNVNIRSNLPFFTYKVFVFDHLILVSKVYNKDYFEMYDLIKILKYVSLKVKKIDLSIELVDENEKIIFLFQDEKNLQTWLEKIESAKFEFTKDINKKITITPIERIDCKINNVAEVITFKPSLNSDIQDRFRSPIVEPQLFYYTEEEGSLLKRLLFGSDIFGTRIGLNFTHPQESDENLIIFSNENGIFKKQNNELKKIHNMKADKIYYDHTFSLMIFISQEKIYVSDFCGRKESISPVLLQKTAVHFFPYTIRNQKYLAVIDSSTDYESKISIYTILLYKQKIRINFVRKAFIGSKIKYMIALDDMLVVASDTAKIINTYTLQTTDFVNPFDQIIPYFFSCIDDKEPKFLRQITKTITLVCYLTFAIYVNRNGTITEEKEVFSWQFEALDYQIFGDYLLVIGEKKCALLKNGNFLFFEEGKEYKMCEINNSLYLYDEKNIYTIKPSKFKKWN
ncbi:Rho Rac Cdc42-like GTPases guanine nucleotide [Tubulinosema ratisbonensis]|uniref:Rho Rac Cdc42-like GTPases guanine nucleotide n=1 Tax=Tubulinosema ratisbonensis TaxID=291195 RepID=A0A437ALK1_9MICR|nr:Rho Rac Cdc42-like GTPases guanine nucleotide [Tubulinosema ratisbonensis]